MGLGARVARFAVRRRRTVLAVSLVLSALSLLSLRALRLDFDVLSILPSGEPAFDEYKQLLETFGQIQTLPVLVSGVERQVLPRAIDALAARYRALPEVAALTAGIELDAAAPYLDPRHAPALLPAARLPELAARLTPEAIATALGHVKSLLTLPGGGELVEHLRRDPLGIALTAAQSIRHGYADPVSAATDRHILAPGGEAGLILLRPVGSPFDAEFTARLFAALARADAAVGASDPAFARLHTRHAGAFAHAREDAALLRRDVTNYTLLALVGMIVIFQLGFRNLTVLPLIGYLLVAGTLLDFAASVLVYHQLNALSLSFTAIFYGLAIDSGIYFYGRLLEERRRAPLAEAVERTCDAIGAANVVASSTTGVAFAVTAFSAIAIVREIGVLTALGMALNLVHTFLLLPALVVTFPGRLAERPPPRPESPLLAALAAFTERHARPMLVLAALLAVAGLAAAPRVAVDAEIRHLRPVRSAATETEDALETAFGALVPSGAVVIRAGDLETALAHEERVVAWLEAHRGAAEAPAIAGYQAFTTFLPSRATEHARRAAFAALPLAEARATLTTELARQGFRAGPFGDALQALTPGDAALPRDLAAPWIAPLAERHLRQGSAGTTLALMVSPAPGTSLALLRERLRAEVDSALVVTGRPLMQEALATVIARELTVFTTLTLGLNLVIVVLRVRAFGIALAVMAPTVVIVLALLAFMHVAGVAFTPVNLIVLPLTLGIGVDNCAYVTERWLGGESIATAVRLVGRAITLTTLTTVAGFGFLAVSRYPALAGLGWLAALAIGLTFVAAVVLLPAFLTLVKKHRRTSPDAD